MADEEIDPFEDVPTTTAETGAPVFTESLGFVDCSIHEAVEAGDHTIYIGSVEAAEQLEDEAALTFFEGEWGSLGTE
jgi:flavin reductase (DIM6/NTAB) family NADH-FMN oxidoreductase RutF